MLLGERLSKDSGSRKLLQKWGPLLDGVPDSEKDARATLLEQSCQRLTKRYLIPVKTADGSDAVMQIGERLHRQLQYKLRDYCEKYGTVDDIKFTLPEQSRPTKPSFEKLPFPIYRRAFASITAKELLSVQPIDPSAGLIFNFPKLKTVVPGTIRDTFSNPLGFDEDIYIPKRQAPAIIADTSHYPHQCPRCGSPAYIGFTSVDCSRKSCG